MSRVRFQAKESGRLILKGNWFKAMVIVLLIMLLTGGLTELDNGYRLAFNIPLFTSEGAYNVNRVSLIISGVYSVLTILFVLPLITGQTEWYWKLTERKELGIGDVFGWFGSFRLYIKSVWLSVNVLVRALLWYVLICGLPFAMIVSAGYLYQYRSDMLFTIYMALLLVAGLILLLGALFLLLFVLSRYYLAFYLLVDDNTRTIRSIVKSSVKMTKGYRWEITKFFITFLLWFMSCYFVIPMFYVIPYFNASSAVFAKHIIYTQISKETGKTSGESSLKEENDKNEEKDQ